MAASNKQRFDLSGVRLMLEAGINSVPIRTVYDVAGADTMLKMDQCNRQIRNNTLYVLFEKGEGQKHVRLKE